MEAFNVLGIDTHKRYSQVAVVGEVCERVEP
mgnify:CR=1 FL=1